jgi:hypothetical protein
MYCTHAVDAFRAIAAQLVHAHRHNRPSLDALSLLIREASEQVKASSDDVLEILALLLRQHSTFLVIDGIDECSDPHLFLTLLSKLCRRSDVRVLLFTRPGLDIPLDYQKWASHLPHVVSLDDSSNQADIESYLASNLNQMADQGYFGVNMDRAHIQAVPNHSNGSFLWASMLLKYLRAPDFLPDERKVSLEQSHLLEGLESLYRLILIGLERRSFEQKRIAADAFRWLSLSIKRLCVPALQTALAVVCKHPTADDQLASRVTNIFGSTCGLVEATEHNVLFAHRSVKDYLQSSACRDSAFNLCDESTAHGHLAARCLSYLANDVPKRPLQRLRPYIIPASPVHTTSGGSLSIRTGSSRDSGYKSMSSASDTDKTTHGTPAPQQPVFGEDLPFLRYAALCWPIHLTRALTDSPPMKNTHTPNTTPFTNLPWLSTLSHFLTDRIAVTIWVEASWLFSLPPNLSRLLPLLTNLKSEIPPATTEGKELRRVIQGLRRLNDALDELRKEHGAAMRENPGLIWQGGMWDGRVVSRGGFWPVWDEGAGRVVGE